MPIYYVKCILTIVYKKNIIKKTRSTSVTHWEALVHMLG